MKIAGVVLLIVILAAVLVPNALAQGPGNVPPPPNAPAGWWIEKFVPTALDNRGWYQSNGWQLVQAAYGYYKGQTVQGYLYRKWQAAPTTAALGLIPRYAVDQYSSCWSQPGYIVTPYGCRPASRWY